MQTKVSLRELESRLQTRRDQNLSVCTSSTTNCVRTGNRAINR